MSCLDNTDILRIVGGNSFQIAITVKARRVADGSEIEDFDLSASSPVLNLIHAGEKTRKYFVTHGNQAIISFDGSEGLGYYGMEMSGSYNSEAWRFCIEKVLQLVDTNAKANIPEWSFLVDDTYFIEGTISIYGGGGGGDTVQADWTEANPTSAAFILHKPDLSVYATKTEVASGLAGKQDTIADLTSIRYGAAAGATAYQKPSSGIPESDMSEGVQTSLGKADSAYQKPSSGIPATDMSESVQESLEKANSAVQTESDPVFSGSPAAEITQADINNWNAKQPAIADLADIREGAAAGATAVQPDEMAQAIDGVEGDIDAINAKIPTAASNLNQLADKAYVNSSIATNSATYRGSFNLITDLGMNVDATHAQIAGALATAIVTADNNDYAFVQIPDSASTPTVIAKIERYKHNGTGWVYEYDLNNSGFTAAQWAAINSGITSGLVGKLSDLPNNSELATLLNGKQNVINDLSAIRSGAAAGATAIQPADLTEALNNVEDEIAGLDESKQDTIVDLTSIRSGAAAGATAYQKPGAGIPESDMSEGVRSALDKAEDAYQLPANGIPSTDMDTEVQAALEKANSAVQTESDPVFSGSPAAEITQADINNWNAKQPAIADLADIREGAAAGATAVQPDEMAQAIDEVDGDIADINAKIPTAASNLNQLADKAYVNSSIATNSATYRGSFNLITDLGMNVDATHAQIAGALATAITTADNNDYAFVQIPDSASTPTVIAKIERYKHNGSGWVYEYDLNNSGFTAAQWAAINSGITSGLVGKLADLPNNSELTTLLNGKQNTISDLSSIRSGASAGATAYQKPSGGIPASDMSSTVQQELSKANTAVQTETDPIFSASPAAGITAQNIQTWNGEPAARQAADTTLQSSVSTLQTDLAAEATARATADALLQQQYNALTQSDIVVGALPATGVPNVIYRVPGTTDFTDYMWYDNQFVPMATYGLPISAEFVVDENLNKTQEEVNEMVGTRFSHFTTVYIEDFPTTGYLEYENSGEVKTNVSWKTSPYIKVKEGDKIEYYVYRYSTNNTIVFYDSQKVVVSMVNNYSSLTQKSLTVPSGASYVRISAEVHQTALQYIRVIDYSLIPDEIPTQNSIRLVTSGGVFGQIDALTTNVDNLDSSLLNDRYLKFVGTDFPIGGYYLSSSNGELQANISYKTSGYISVDSSTKVEIRLVQYSSAIAVVFYNSEKEIVSYTSSYPNLVRTLIDVPSGASYVRVSAETVHYPNSDQYVKVIDLSSVSNNAPKENSVYPISSGAVYNSLLKDTVPTIGSSKLLTSDAVASALVGLESKIPLVPILGTDFPISGYYLSSSNGELQANINYKTSDYIPVSNGDGIEVFLFQISGAVAIVYYDDSKSISSYTSNYPSLSKTKLRVPSGASYVRVSAETGHYGNSGQYIKVIDSSVVPEDDQKVITPFIDSCKVYTVCNDIGSSSNTSIDSRNYSSRIYLDHFYKGLTNKPKIKIDGKTNFFPFYSIYEIGYMTKYINNRTKGQTSDLNTRTETVKVVGAGENVAEVNLSINHISTRNLATVNKHVRLLCIGDSVTAGANAAVNKPYANAPETYWEWVQALFNMDNIENNGGFDCVTIGNQITLPIDVYGGTWRTVSKKTFDINLNGLTQNDVMACAVARAGAKVEWYLQEDNANIFWDSSANKVSIQSWINKYRTLVVNNDGSTTRCDSTNKGSAVTDVNAYNVCEPTHVLLAFGYNQTYGSDNETRTKYLADLNTMISIIREEFPNAYILLQLPDTAGTYFPELFGNYMQESNDLYSMDYTKGIAKTIHDGLCYMNKDLMDLENVNSKIYYVPSYFVSPLCYGAGSRIVNDIAHLSNGFDESRQFVEGGTNGPHLHPNNTAHACWAYQIYSLIKYTLTL